MNGNGNVRIFKFVDRGVLVILFGHCSHFGVVKDKGICRRMNFQVYCFSSATIHEASRCLPFDTMFADFTQMTIELGLMGSRQECTRRPLRFHKSKARPLSMINSVQKLTAPSLGRFVNMVVSCIPFKYISCDGCLERISACEPVHAISIYTRCTGVLR